MSKDLRFDGKVAIVTGAGGGLGRSHALLLAARGAQVVVNDLGGSHTGEGKSASAADKVVDEIKAAGGRAVANYDSVEDGAAIVKTAIDAFGRLDILINNAGILRDVSFPKMSETDWDLIYRVHVLGAFRCTFAAWPYMRDQGYGRIIMTASAAGIYGNFGQANYSMAKLGLVGLANTLAIEGRKRNVLVNTIAPLAGSRMTETVMPPNLLEALKPEMVSPLVARLCHESSEETGGLFEVGGGFMGKLRWERAAGKTFRLGRAVTPEAVDAAWSEIATFDKATHPGNVMESMQPIMKNLEDGPSKGGNDLIDVDAALGFRFPDLESSYDERDIALYALGVGAATNPTDEKDLQLVYELHGKGMKALPTYAVIPAVNTVLTLGKQGKSAPGLHYGLDRVLHGEQYTELKRPLPLKAKLTHRSRIKDIFDKGKNALVVTEIISYDEQGMELCRNELTTFVRGGGGWGGDRGPSQDVNVPPDRAPDKVVEEKVPEHQALLYRLSGDWNPLHADPGFAKAFGFDKPILHGLCSFGYAGRHVVQSFAPDGNPDYVKSIRVRFASPVTPGETLVTEMWKEGGKVVFRVSAKERNQVVISNAAIELWSEIPKPVAKAATSAGVAATPISTDIFRAMTGFIAANPEVVEKAKTVFQFKLANPDSVWTLDLKAPPGAVSEGATAPAQCTLELSDADFMAMATGQSDPMVLFTSGKLKISGDVMASQKLGFLKKISPDSVIAEMNKRLGGGAAAAPATAPSATKPASPAPSAAPTAPAFFEALTKRLADKPELAKEVGALVVFRVTAPDAAWTVDLVGAPSVKPGAAAGAHAVITLADADLAGLSAGRTRELFQRGKLRVDGDVSVAHRLGFLKGL